MRNLILFSAFLASVLFTGCNDQTIPTPSGEIPREYLEVARTFGGIWLGALSGGVTDPTTRSPVVTKGSFDIQVPNVRPVVTFNREDGKGSDLLLPECGSRIGQMISIEVHGASKAGSKGHPNPKKKGTLIGVTFEFDPGRCAGELNGRTLMLQFSAKRGQTVLDPSIYAYQGQRQEFSDVLGWHTVFFDVYFSGPFER